MKRAPAVLIAVFLLLPSSSASAAAQTECTFSVDLHVGSRGASVACLQQSLMGKGYVIPAGATGYFGRETKSAVALWQHSMGVSPSVGYFGARSRHSFISGSLSGTVVSPPVISAATSTAAAPAVIPQFAAAVGGGGGAAISPPISVPAQTAVPSAPEVTSSAAPPAPHVSEIFGTLSSTVGRVASSTAVDPAGSILWSCDFENNYCGMYEQSALEPSGHRSFFATTSRSGALGVELQTQPGDANIHGSGAWERDDLELPPSSDYCNEGQEEWWAVSVYFPSDYVMPKEGMEVMDFHDNASGGQANVNFVSDPDQLRIVGYGGDFNAPTEYTADLGTLVRGQWYDLVYHAKWSSGENGLMQVWVNGTKVLDHAGPTLYKGISCYLKLADYHDALGVPEPVIFDRVIRGTSAQAVTPLK